MRPGASSHQLEQEGQAHDEGMGRQKILLAPDHERACGQVLPTRRCLGDLPEQQNHPAQLTLAFGLPHVIRLSQEQQGRAQALPREVLCKCPSCQV